jgi:MFS family permease
MKFKFPFSRNEIFFAAVYFVQAAVGISSIAQFIFTRNELGLNFIQLGILAALPTISWSIKPIYGFLTDLVPIRGYRRRPYLHIMPIVTVLSWLYIWQFADSFISFAIPLMIANIGLGFTDVIADGLVVQQSDEKTAGRFQSICWGALSVGAIISTFFSGFLLGREILDIRQMFFITALMPLMTFGLSFFVKEQRIKDKSELKVHKAISPSYIYTAILAFIVTIILLYPYEGQNMSVASMAVIGVWFIWLAGYFKHLMDIKIIGKGIFAAAIFIFLWRFTPSFGAPWQDYFLNKIGIDQETYGYFGVTAYIGWLVGSILFAKLFDKVSLRKVLFWTIVLSSVLGLTQLGLTKPELGNAIGNLPIIKYMGAVIASPVFFIAHGTKFWSSLMQMQGLVFLNFVLDFFLGILYMVSFIALLKFAALSTPKNLEGTNFAVFASIMNFGLVFGSISGGMIYENVQNGLLGFNGLQITVILGVVTSLIALLAMPWIKTEHMAHEHLK